MASKNRNAYTTTGARYIYRPRLAGRSYGITAVLAILGGTFFIVSWAIGSVAEFGVVVIRGATIVTLYGFRGIIALIA